MTSIPSDVNPTKAATAPARSERPNIEHPSCKEEHKRRARKDLVVQIKAQCRAAVTCDGQSGFSCVVVFYLDVRCHEVE
jgi:hypothetical protein